VESARSARSLAILTAAFVLAFWKWDANWLYPLRLLSTLFHELGHGFAGILTGGSIDHIEIYANGGGLCFVSGGLRWLILPAGYMGSMAAGCGIILVSARTKWDRELSLVLGLVIFVSTLLWVRTSAGLTYGLLSGGVLAGAGYAFGEEINEAVLSLIGAMSAMNSLFGLKYLWTYSGQNDALFFSREIFPLPQGVWATLWIALSALSLALTLRVALGEREQTLK
jgi:hypothetical protein